MRFPLSVIIFYIKHLILKDYKIRLKTYLNIWVKKMYCEDHDQGKWEPLEVTKKRFVVPESLLFAKREIRTEPCSLTFPGGPAESALTTYQAGKETQTESWPGTTHGHAGSLNPGNSGSNGCVLAVNPRARQNKLRHQGILKFISVSAYHSGLWGH